MLIYKIANIFVGLLRQNIGTDRPAYASGSSFTEVFIKLTK